MSINYNEPNPDPNYGNHNRENYGISSGLEYADELITTAEKDRVFNIGYRDGKLTKDPRGGLIQIANEWDARKKKRELELESPQYRMSVWKAGIAGYEQVSAPGPKAPQSSEAQKKRMLSLDNATLDYLDERVEGSWKDYLEHLSLASAAETIQPRGGKNTGWMFIVVGLILMMAEYVMAVNILGDGFKLNGKLPISSIGEKWLFGLGVVMITFLLKISWERLVEMPWIQEIRKLNLANHSNSNAQNSEIPLTGHQIESRLLPRGLQLRRRLIITFQILVMVLTLFTLGHLALSGKLRHQIHSQTEIKKVSEDELRAAKIDLSNHQNASITAKQQRLWRNQKHKLDSIVDAKTKVFAHDAKDLLDLIKGDTSKWAFLTLNLLFPIGSAICLSIGIGMAARVRRRKSLADELQFWDSALNYAESVDEYLENEKNNFGTKYDHIKLALLSTYWEGFKMGQVKRPYLSFRDNIVHK